MEYIYRKGAAGALMDEYEKAVAALKRCTADISDEELVFVADKETADPNCRSVQTILTHVVSSAYSYAIYIQSAKGIITARPGKVLYNDISAYHEALDKAMAFTSEVFDHLNDDELEQPDEAKKIKTTWVQVYDIEQMAEHAIVHILRHRRQIEKFKIRLRTGHI